MERRIGLRARTDFSVRTSGGVFDQRVRAIELSGSGIVVTSAQLDRDQLRPMVLKLCMQLPERFKPVLALARSVRTYGYQEALRFIEISDVDRLNLAEHLDVVYRRGSLLN